MHSLSVALQQQRTLLMNRPEGDNILIYILLESSSFLPLLAEHCLTVSVRKSEPIFFEAKQPVHGRCRIYVNMTCPFPYKENLYPSNSLLPEYIAPLSSLRKNIDCIYSLNIIASPFQQTIVSSIKKTRHLPSRDYSLFSQEDHSLFS